MIDHLRPYQKRDYRDVLARCERVRSVLYVAFMGSGKTVLAAALIRTWMARGERTLILTHTREILRQTHEKLLAAGVEESRVGWIWRDHARTNAEASIQLASLDTLARRDYPKDITRIVVDEAHHATAKKWRNVIDAYPQARVLGLTGTPVRLDGQPLGEVFDEMIESEPVENLIEQGWIARPSYWTPAWNIALPRRSGGDFSDLVAAGLIPHSKILESMVEEYSKHAAGLPALGFAATREKAVQYAAHFTASGIVADTLFGSDTDLKRQSTLARLREGALRVLWTCNVLGEGWDYPGLRCVMLARPTLSIARYLQQVARCMRPGEAPVVLDLWGAWSLFDPPWADFGWSLHTRTRKPICAGKRDVAGEVTWLPPVEVSGRLVRADATMRQTICCGYRDQPCPDQTKPHLTALSPAVAATRHGAPWRCKSCFLRSRRIEALCVGSSVPCPDRVKRTLWISRATLYAKVQGLPVGQFRCKKCAQKSDARSSQRVCAGFAGNDYVCARCPPYRALQRDSLRQRNNEPWRCASCRSGMRRNPKSFQTECAGYSGNTCSEHARPPAKAFTPSMLARRNGEPWRCQACTGRFLRPRKPQPECAGWQGACPNKSRASYNVISPRHVKERQGEPWRCRACNARRRHDAPIPDAFKPKKLSAKDARIIRKKAKDASVAAMAKEFDVSRSAIRRVVSKVTFKRV